MVMLFTSPGALTVAGTPETSVVEAIKRIDAAGHKVYVFSNRDMPSWFNVFHGLEVEFHKEVGRQTGVGLAKFAANLGLSPGEILVLGTSADDMQMAKNSGGIFLSGGWGTDATVRDVGLAVSDPATLEDVVRILDTWEGAWWFEATEPKYSIRVIADLSSFYVPNEQVDFAKKLTHTAKQGGAGLIPVAAVTARSLLHDGVNQVPRQMWGLYPSSSSANDDHEVLTKYTHGLRTMLGRSHHAERGAPLFVRHAPSTKRSKAGKSIDREDPTEQIQTLYLNPDYQASVRGKNIFIVDDCTTHGVSFGVASAFLRAAGAATVTCVAIGKLGNQLKYYDIELGSSPFKPVTTFKTVEMRPMQGKPNPAAQQDLQILLP